jgi:hypothetical protein
MGSFSQRLAKLEARLESLIQEDLARILPNSDPRMGVSKKITAAIQANSRQNEAGQSIAPDLYILVIDPELAQVFSEEPTFSEQFSEIIAEAGLETGIQFNTRPRVKISADQTKRPGQFEIQATFGLPEMDRTSAFTINSDDASQVPEYAFLIIHGTEIFPLTQQVVNLGRRTDNHIVLEDKRVSRIHAQIRAIERRYVIFDLDSSGGTYVNGERYLAGGNAGETQPLMPFPDPEKSKEKRK